MTRFFRIKPSRTQSTQIQHKRWGPIAFVRSARLRRLRVSVEPWEGIVIKGPSHAKGTHAHKLIDTLNEWLESALIHNEKLEKTAKSFYDSVEGMNRSAVKKMLSERLELQAQTHNFMYSKLIVRDQKTRWGSCSSRNVISLNQKLQFLPAHLIDYVLIHELAHTRHKHHGPQFWQAVYNILGESATRRRRDELKTYTFLFYPPPEVS